MISGIVIAASAAYALFQETALTHDLLSGDFETGADPFVALETDEHLLDVVDGTIWYKVGPELPRRTRSHQTRAQHHLDC